MNEIERQLNEKSKDTWLGEMIHQAAKYQVQQGVNSFDKRMKRLYKNVHKDERKLIVVTFK